MQGVDNMRATFRITEEQTALRCPDGMSMYNDRGGMRLEGDLRLASDVSFYVKVDTAKGSMVVEWNPSRLVSRTGGLCPFEMLPVARDSMLQLVDQELGVYVLPEDRDRAEVRRCDVARDFVVSGGVDVIEQLIGYPRAYSTKLEQQRDPKTFTTTGLVIGGKLSHAKLYLRPAEHPAHAGKDWLRFEVTARDEWLRAYLFVLKRPKRVPITFADLTVENCERLLKNRWLWSKFGSKHTAVDDWWQRARELTRTPEQMRGFIAYVFSTAHGQDLGYKRDSVKQFSDWIDRLGPPPAPGEQSRGASSQRLRLDHDKPRAVVMTRRRGATAEDMAPEDAKLAASAPQRRST